MTTLQERITDYLELGGLFNPELMDPAKVRDLLVDCRDALARAGAGAPTREPSEAVEQVAVQVPQTVTMLREYARTERKLAMEDKDFTADMRTTGIAAAQILDDLAAALPELVAAAGAPSAGDTERLDILTEYCDDIKWVYAKGGKRELRIEWFIGDGSPSFVTQAPTWREAIDQALRDLSAVRADSPKEPR